MSIFELVKQTRLSRARRRNRPLVVLTPATAAAAITVVSHMLSVHKEEFNIKLVKLQLNFVHSCLPKKKGLTCCCVAVQRGTDEKTLHKRFYILLVSPPPLHNSPVCQCVYLLNGLFILTFTFSKTFCNVDEHAQNDYWKPEISTTVSQLLVVPLQRDRLNRLKQDRHLGC